MYKIITRKHYRRAFHDFYFNRVDINDKKSGKTQKSPKISELIVFSNIDSFRVLEPAPQGMGAPQAMGNTQGNDVEAHRNLPEGSLSPSRIHLMPATMMYVAYYTTRSHPDGGLRRIFVPRKHA